GRGIIIVRNSGPCLPASPRRSLPHANQMPMPRYGSSAPRGQRTMVADVGRATCREHVVHFDRLPHDSSGCGWYDVLPARPEPIRVYGEQAADWVVLGAGLTGLAAARQLAMLRPQARIALVDAQRVGYGASGRNSGFMIDLPHNLNSRGYIGEAQGDQRIIRRNRAAIAFMREIVHTHGIDCDWDEQGKIHAAATRRGASALAEFARGLDALNEPYTKLTAADIERITGSSYYLGGMHTPGTVLVQPAKLVRGLARTLPDNVRVYE